MGVMKHRSLRMLLASLLALPLLAGCVQSIPADPDGTLDDIRSGTLHVGVTPNAEFVQADGEQVRGTDIDMVSGFAERLGAQVEWTIAGEEQLVTELEAGRLDLVAGGITSKTPWAEDVGITRPYATHRNGDGKEIKLVLLVPPGENAFLVELERYLDQTQEMP